MSSGLLAIRASGDAHASEQKRQQERRRNLLVLVHGYLIENGYTEAAERLAHEANGSGVLGRYSTADNVDLSLILTEFEAYHELKFDRKPKVVRRLGEGEVVPEAGPSRRSAPSSGSGKKPAGSTAKKSTTANDSNEKLPSISGSTPISNGIAGEPDFGVTGTTAVSRTNPAPATPVQEELPVVERLLRPPPSFGGDPELKALAGAISRDIYQHSPSVRFSDIIELDDAKRLLLEAVQLPIRFPSLFTGILRPWRGILLHGPPGTGKTLLAKAVATECHTTFFNVSAATLVSKWRGDSEKLVRVLFELARYHAPSTLFIDEIDSMLTARDGEGGEHEASRRLKTELLVQMDGLPSGNHSSTNPSPPVFVMAASNLPWDLDVALLRRLEKRVFVPLPGQAARQSMLAKHLSDRVDPQIATSNFEEFAHASEGYSGADLELVAREAAMMPVRRLLQRIDLAAVDVTPEPPTQKSSLAGSRRGGAAKPITATTSMTAEADIERLLREDPVTADDLRAALRATKPSSDGKTDKYEKWQHEYGAS